MKKTAMTRYVCRFCGYIYDPRRGDPEHGIEPGTPFEALPEDWRCPECGAAPTDFAAWQEKDVGP